MKPACTRRSWLVLGMIGAFVQSHFTYAAEPISAARQRELIHLVRQDCGACHGLSLQGGLGTPLTPAALRDKPVDSLAATILYGRTGTPMPPFKTLLSETEATWIAAKLLSGFPHEE